MKLGLCGQDDCPRPYEFCEACVRADERERIVHNVTAEWAKTVHDYEADLRVKVEALPDVPGGRWFMRPAVYRHDVLALLDGSS